MRLYFFYTVLIIGLAFTTSCEEDNLEEKHWSYQGETSPEHWAELGDNDCDGMYQSPVDIISTESDTTLTPLDIHYDEKTKIFDVTNNGHSIQFNFDPGDYIVLNGEKYTLQQFHFHEAAEHTIKGVRYPLEIHLVHADEAGRYVVLSVMAEESETNSKPFDFLESYLPLSVNETKAVNVPFNIYEVLPKEKSYYTYTGSLTTPPCTEGVQWFIFKEPVGISLEMLEELQNLMPLNNYRDIQPINGRVIRESE